MDRVVEYELRFSQSPLASNSTEEVERFLRFVENVNQRKERVAAIVTLTAGQHFITRDFVEELSSETYFDDLFARVVRWQHIGNLIARSGHLWVFAHSVDCYGAMFDLAMAFDYRFCFNSRARVGFPSLGGNLLPFVGPFLQRYGRSSRRRKLWEKRNVLRASDALESNLLNFVANHSDWRPNLLRWIDQQFEDQDAISDHSIHLEEPDPAKCMEVALRRIAMEEDLSKARPGRETFEASWALAAKIRSGDQSDLYVAIAYMSARTMVSRAFLVWANRHLALGGSHYWLDPDRSKSLYVDMDFLAPPVKPLVRLIESGFKIVFASPEGGRLKEGVDLMYARFENHLSRPDAQTLWRDGTAWYTGEIEKVKEFPVARWLANDRVNVSSADGELSFLRFFGNRGSAECGWAELAMSDLDTLNDFHQSYEIARIMSDGIVKTRKLADGQVDLSTVLRSLLLEEILTVSSMLHGATGKLLPALRDAGWGYIADDNSWEYFLRAREETYRIAPAKVKLGVLSVDPQVWQMGVWREGRELAKQNGKSERFSWNPIYLSRHFATYAGLLTQQVVRSGSVKHAADADRFVSGCVGFPEDLGTPLTFVDALGKKRFEYYCRRFWPHGIEEERV